MLASIEEDSVRFIKEMNATKTREEFTEVIAAEMRRFDFLLLAIWLDSLNSEYSGEAQ